MTNITYITKAKIRFFTDKEISGRITPIYSKYRPSIIFLDGHQCFSSITFNHKEFLELGETNEVDITFQTKMIPESNCFIMREGLRVVGLGEIVKVIEEKIKS